MKIGVFGDSYCDKNANSAWWQLLKNFGHEIDCFGESASSILYSADLIDKKAKDYDLIIWCLTSSSRISVKLDCHPYYLHFSNAERYDEYKFANYEAKIKAGIVKDFYKYALDIDQYHLVGKSLAYYILSRGDVMIIPCFPEPLSTNFNLSEISNREIADILKGHAPAAFYEQHKDLRTCHLTPENNEILANLLADKLRPGIFSADYTDFVFSGDCSQYFDLTP